MLIHGLPESGNKNTDELVIHTIKEKMREEVKKNKINQSHRLGASTMQNNDQDRPIVIKFARYNTSYWIFKNKKILKGKSISVTEKLEKKISFWECMD